jgi:hypothetical protein
MGKPLRDLTGQAFGFLVAVELGPKLKATSGAWWLCECECGNTKSIRSSDLTGGKVRSCGCKHQALKGASLTRHGGRGTRTYRIWCAMKTRCSNPNAASYSRYGGRGIAVSPEWERFEAFLADMGECPDGMSIDRIDNNGGYSAGNCRWATKVQQANNTSTNIVIEHDGKRMTRSEWERSLGLGATTVRSRLRRGLSLENALQPLRELTCTN